MEYGRTSFVIAALFGLIGATLGRAAEIVVPVLTLQPQPESVYAPPDPPREDDGFNQGAVHLNINVRYMTDHVFRGIDRSEFGTGEDSPNLQFDGKVQFDLGKLPHPFIQLFVNVFDADPISRFQEVRPSFGFDWEIKPVTLSAGHTTYIYPERDNENTSEIFGKIALDDSFIWHTQRPLIAPYILAAYDYDLYKGWYFEVGVRHDIVFDDWGLTLSFVADATYVLNHQYFTVDGTNDSGFQHYDVGVIGTYSLNNVLNIPKRYGEFAIQGFLYYTDNIEEDLRGDNQIWGGAGIDFKY